MKLTSIIRRIDVGRRVLDGAVVAEAGIADHDVEAAERRSALRSTSRGTSVSEVTSMATASARPPRRANVADGLLEPVRAPRAEHDRDAGAREMPRHRQADARGGARDHRDASARDPSKA